MKKRISFILTVAMIFSILASPISNAQMIDLSSQQEDTLEDTLVEMPVYDTEGNYMGVVTMSSRSASAIAAGAYVTFKGIKALMYTGYIWVCTHPEETLQTLQFLIDGFSALQNTLGMLQSADHDGENFVSAETVSGNFCVYQGGGLWACRYSV